MGPATEPPPSSRFQERIVATALPSGVKATSVRSEARGAFVAELHPLPLGAKVVGMVVPAEAADHTASLEHVERPRVGLIGADLKQCSALGSRGVECASLTCAGVAPGGDGDLILLERYVVEGEGGHRTQRGRYIDEPVELRPVWCGVLRGEGCAEAQGDACSVCTGMWRCVLLQGGCVRGRACASVIECVDALTNRSSFLLSKNTSLATALPPELRST
eukprot:scaffold98814_cov73-Phaeocystis_antarctica.AAC.9